MRRDSNNSIGSAISDTYSEASESFSRNSVAPTSMSVRPFSASEAFAFPKPPSTGTCDSWQSTIGRTYSITNDPFTASLTSNVQFIQQSFHPGEDADDELMVAVGDRVSIFRVFDDGWVVVRKYEGNGAVSASGLIPAKCFSKQGSLLPENLVAG